MMMKNIKGSIVKSLLDNDGVNITANIKQHVGTLVPTLLQCSTCGALDYDNRIHIIFNRKFYNVLNREERRFCILHEIGHYVSTDEGFSRDIYSESIADSYAFKHMGYETAIKAMQGIYNKLNAKEAREEFKARMETQKQIQWCKQVIHSNYI